MEEIAEANGENEKRINIVHKGGSLALDVSSPKVRDYLVRMLNKLFALEKAKAAKDDSGGGSSGSKDDDRGRREGRIQVSQVKLYACRKYNIKLIFLLCFSLIKVTYLIRCKQSPIDNLRSF